MIVKDFKVVHLSTSHNGGAGIAARRLHQALLSSGEKSIFVALNRKDFLPQNGEVDIYRAKTIRLLGVINSLFSQAISSDTYFSLFSVSAINYKSLKKLGNPENTIFHIHNWFNLINLRIIRKLLKDGYRIVFTLHDQRLFTGGCHYSLACEKFKTNCAKCPMLPIPINRVTKWNVIRIEKLFRKFSNNILALAPSNWIKYTADNSFVMKNIETVSVLNIHKSPANLDAIFAVRNKTKLSKRTVLGVASMNKQSTIKGGQVLKKLEEIIDAEKIDAEIIYLADFQSEFHDSQMFWGAIDYLLVTSKIDNSPNVIHEAKLLGIPIIATNVGGIPELLNFDYDHLIEMDEKVLEQITTILRNINENPKKIDTYKIIENYKIDTDKTLDSILELYRSLMLRLN
jgi:glycosyltransferase involved in cell wall biosynthesis